MAGHQQRGGWQSPLPSPARLQRLAERLLLLPWLLRQLRLQRLQQGVCWRLCGRVLLQQCACRAGAPGRLLLLLLPQPCLQCLQQCICWRRPWLRPQPTHWWAIAPGRLLQQAVSE